MITEIEEIGEHEVAFREAQAELAAENIPFDPAIPLGIMIEVPAAAALADVLIKDVDYFSIGTNDLIQYYLAVDRSNEFVSYLFKPLHPAVLRLLKTIIEAALRAGKDVTVCGEMAADPLSVMVLLGLGLRTFGMGPIFIPAGEERARAVDLRTVKRPWPGPWSCGRRRRSKKTDRNAPGPFYAVSNCLIKGGIEYRDVGGTYVQMHLTSPFLSLPLAALATRMWTVEDRLLL